MNVYLVETPHQLLNAIEAKHALELQNNLLLVITLEEYPREAYEPLIVGGEWQEVRFLPTCIENRGRVARYLKDHPSERVQGYFNTYELRELRKLLDRQASSLSRVENLFLGNYFRTYMRHFGNVVKPRRLCLLDDGTVTLSIHAVREQMHAGCGTYSLDTPSFRKKLITRLLGYRARQAASLTFFTTYDLAMSNSDHLIRNEYGYFRQKAMRCQPKGRTQDRGSALKTPTKHVLKTSPFHPPCSRDLTGKRSGTMRVPANGASKVRNSALENFLRHGASSCSRATFMTLDSAFNHEMRLYTMKMAVPPGFSTR